MAGLIIGLFVVCFFVIVIVLELSKLRYASIQDPPKNTGLVDALVDEVNTALSLNHTEVTHKFSPAEPKFDSDVAGEVTFKVCEKTPCVIAFSLDDNGDLKMLLYRIMTN